MSNPALIEDRSIPVPFSGCWLWTSSIDTSGYGHLRYGGRVDKAHRVSWMASYGAIPEGMFVCHKCDVRSCVNPDHLFLGTTTDNMRDMMRKGRGLKARGERHGTRTHPEKISKGDDHFTRRIPGIRRWALNGRAKLNVIDVAAIRASEDGPCALGRRYGVSHVTIIGIKTRRLWSHL